MTKRIIIPSMLAAILVAAAGIALTIGSSAPTNPALRAALSNMCDPILTRYYDTTVYTDGDIDTRTPTWNIRHDGADYHATQRTTDGTTIEDVRIDGIRYYRNGANAAWQEVEDDDIFAGICVDPPASGGDDSNTRNTRTYAYAGFTYSYLGQVSLGGQNLRHYRSAPLPAETDASTAQYDINFAGTVDEIWVNDTGHIEKIERDLVINYAFDGVRKTHRGRVLIEASGIGQTNIISYPPGVTPPTTEPNS